VEKKKNMVVKKYGLGEDIYSEAKEIV